LDYLSNRLGLELPGREGLLCLAEEKNDIRNKGEKKKRHRVARGRGKKRKRTSRHLEVKRVDEVIGSIFRVRGHLLGGRRGLSNPEEKKGDR